MLEPPINLNSVVLLASDPLLAYKSYLTIFVVRLAFAQFTLVSMILLQLA
jgi:hypothetical protein